MKKIRDFNIKFVPSGDYTGDIFSEEDNKEWFYSYADFFDNKTCEKVEEVIDDDGRKIKICFKKILETVLLQCEIIKNINGYVEIYDHNRTQFMRSYPIGYIMGKDADEFFDIISSMVNETERRS